MEYQAAWTVVESTLMRNIFLEKSGFTDDQKTQKIQDLYSGR